MKLKAQREIWEDKAILHKTKYREIDQELMVEIKLCPIKTQQFQSTLWERNCTTKEKILDKNYVAEKSAPKRKR